MTMFKRGTVWSISYYMEMKYHMCSSIELGIASDGTNNGMCYNIICVDGMDEYCYTTHV